MGPDGGLARTPVPTGNHVGRRQGPTSRCVLRNHAESVELCLFDEQGTEQRVPVTNRQAQNWHCYLPGVAPGQRYGYRVHGPYDPGQRASVQPRTSCLIDPYAKAIEGLVDFSTDGNVLPYVPSSGGDDDDFELDDEDDAASIPKSVVVDPGFDWEGDRPLRIPFADTVIYETHVRGFTMTHPEVRGDLRGTYAGLASEPALAVPAGPRASRRSATATDPSHRRRVVPGRVAGSRTTGVTARSGISPRIRNTRPPAVTESRCANSRAWSRRCTAPASR